MRLNMNCDRANNLLSAYADGELDAGERVDVEGHLSTCAACRSAAEALRLQDADLRRAFAPRRRAAAAVAERLELESPAGPSPAPARTGATGRRWWGVAVAAAAAGFLLAVALLRLWP